MNHVSKISEQGVIDKLKSLPKSAEPKSGNNQISILGYLNEKIKYLEIENLELKKEISFKCSDNEKIEYYLRLRKELLEEIERLKNENIASQLSSNGQVERLRQEVDYLTKLTSKKEVEMSSPKSNELECFSTQRTFRLIEGRDSSKFRDTGGNFGMKTSSKYFQPLNDEAMTSNFSEEMFPSQNFSSDRNLSIKLGNEKELAGLQSSTAPFTSSNFFEEQFASAASMKIEQPVVHNSSPQNPSTANPYLPIISDLEDRIKLLENIVKEKDVEITKLSFTQAEENSRIIKQNEILQKDIESWKQKYVSVLNSKKSLSEEYSELANSFQQNIKKETEKTIFDLEKKIVQLEKLNCKLEQDSEQISKMSAESEHYKQRELDILKTNTKTVIDHYEQLYRVYEENMKNLTKQTDNLKQLYVARETEFINITNYYTETIDNYSKPITDLSNPNAFQTLEERYVSQTKETEELRKKLDESIRENTKLRTDFIEAKPKMRQKISEALFQYDENIKQIVDNHNNLEGKLENILSFMKYFDEKFIFFSSLIEDNKKLEEKINILECQIRVVDIDSKNEEIYELKESNLRLARDCELKSMLLKEYEDQFSRATETIAPGQKKRKDLLSSEIVLKLKTEISLLSAQILSLNRTKDSIEKFYQNEIKKNMENLYLKNEKIEDLRSVIRKMENDYTGKKETIFNLWMLEFKEFKNNLITIADIKSLIERFKVEGEELTVHRDRIFNEEFYMLREEIKVKDGLYNDAQKNYEKEKKNLDAMIEGYKKNIDGKLLIYEDLSNLKKFELSALKAEKESLKALQFNKKGVILQFNFRS